MLPSPSNDDAVTTPVKLAVEPVKIPVTTIPLGFACAFTLPPLSLIAVASIPVNPLPSPWNLVADIAPSEIEIAVPTLKPVAVVIPETLTPLGLNLATSDPLEVTAGCSSTGR